MAQTKDEHFHFIDRMTDIAIEHQLVAQAHAHNEADVNEVSSFLSENGLGDEANPGRVARAAHRLQNEGVLVEKNGRYRVAEDARPQVDRTMELAKDAFTAPWEDTESGTGP